MTQGEINEKQDAEMTTLCDCVKVWNSPNHASNKTTTYAMISMGAFPTVCPQFQFLPLPFSFHL